jgi:hypothetical protein
MNTVMFLGGLTLLEVGANMLVRGTSKMAMSFGISPLVNAKMAPKSDIRCYFLAGEFSLLDSHMSNCRCISAYSASRVSAEMSGHSGCFDCFLPGELSFAAVVFDRSDFPSHTHGLLNRVDSHHFSARCNFDCKAHHALIGALYCGAHHAAYLLCPGVPIAFAVLKLLRTFG